MATFNFKLLSLNARGIRDFHKRKAVLHGLRNKTLTSLLYKKPIVPRRLKINLRWLNRVMQDDESRASDLNRKLIFSFILLFS